MTRFFRLMGGMAAMASALVVLAGAQAWRSAIAGPTIAAEPLYPAPMPSAAPSYSAASFGPHGAAAALHLPVPTASAVSGASSGAGAPIATMAPRRATVWPVSLLPEAVLRAHNPERARLGMAPLVWDQGLATEAGEWAEQLARTGQFEHSAAETRRHAGENLFMGTGGGFSPEAMIADFIAEREDFAPGVFPAVARDGDWHNVGHYTQIIWRHTQKVGCAMAHGPGAPGERPDRRGQDYLVCRYWPAGNIYGQSVP